MVKRKLAAAYENSLPSNQQTNAASISRFTSTSSDASSRSRGRHFVTQVNEQNLDDFVGDHLPTDSLQYSPSVKERSGSGPGFPVYNITVRSSPSSSHIRHHTTEDQLDACYRLIDETSGDAYRSSGFGWHPMRKKREMREADMRYLLVEAKTIDNADSPGFGGFCSFMLTYEDGDPVIYIYEIHLVSTALGCGLGRHMLGIIEHIGTSVGVDKVMLTVFRSNERARKWYHANGYVVDEYSPPDKKLRGGKVKKADYLILSKLLKAS